jgi:hypothetical protein
VVTYYFENIAVFDSKQVELLYVRQHSGMYNTTIFGTVSIIHLLTQITQLIHTFNHLNILN